ncbi:MAG TPA: hypothetical protein DFS52_16570 [Myxococcales bacterium]|nr:hypothetical protein [Myxococcales bacterium]
MAKSLPEKLFFAAEQIPRNARVLDLGCGEQKRVPWAVGLDRVKTGATDVVHELDVHPWPFEDDAFDVILMSHVIEHVGDVVRLSQELHRIGRPGAIVRIATPHFTNPDAFVDPTHRHAFGWRSLEYFADAQHAPQPWLQSFANRVLGMDASVAGWYSRPLFEIVERRITFRRLHRLIGLDRFARELPLFYEYFLGGLAPARDLQFVLRVLKP